MKGGTFPPVWYASSLVSALLSFSYVANVEEEEPIPNFVPLLSGNTLNRIPDQKEIPFGWHFIIFSESGKTDLLAFQCNIPAPHLVQELNEIILNGHHCISKSVVNSCISIMEFGANSNKSPFLSSILNQIECNLSAHGINNSAFLQLVGLVDEKVH